MLAEADKQAEMVKGDGDAQALEIYAYAYNQDAEFYRFWRSLESYKTALDQGTSIVLSSDSEYLRFLNTMEAAQP